VDVREPGEYATAKLPLFKLWPLSRASDWVPTLESDLDPEKETIVLCHHGVRSMQMSQVSEKKQEKLSRLQAKEQ
jgi:rhodanese-related sulfurtransferase